VTPVRIFSPEYYRALHDIERSHPWARAMRRLEIALIRRFAPAAEPLRTLDAGCGAGLFLAELTALHPSVLPFGGDLSRDALRLAGQTGHRLLVEFDVRRLPFADASFDLILSNDVLQHLGRAGAAEALREAARVLRPQGLLTVRTAARRGLLWGKHRDSANYCQWGRRQFRRLLGACGFEPRFAARVNWLPSLLADLRGLLRSRPAGDTGLELLQDEPVWKERLLELYWRCERQLLLFNLYLRLPVGHNLVAAATQSRSRKAAVAPQYGAQNS
jgi:SAM-dependent methyltransferase